MADSVARWRVLAAYAAVYIIWGSTYLAIRVAITTLPPFLMAGVRFTIAGTLLFLWSRRRGAALPSAAEWRGGALIGALLLLFGNGALVWSEQRVASGLAALFVAVVPLWTALLEWLRHSRRPGPRTVAGLVLGLGGVALLAAPGHVAGGAAIDPVGAMALLFGSVAWSLGSVLSRGATLPPSPPMSAGVQMLGGGAGLLLLALVTGEPAALSVGAVSATSLVAFGYLIVFGSLVGFSAFAWLLRVEPATRVATYAYVNPAVAMVLGWAVLGEPLTPRSLVAAAVIVGGVILITNERR